MRTGLVVGVIFLNLAATAGVFAQERPASSPVSSEPVRCVHVMCPMYMRRCPPGEVWGKRNLTDCCNDACVPDRCARVRCPHPRRCPPETVWGKRDPSDCCKTECVKR
jgi:hypothetical protein